MRTRSISSVGVVVVGLLPMMVGGTAFAVLMTVLCLLGYREYQGLIARLPAGSQLLAIGYPVVIGAAIAGLVDPAGGTLVPIILFALLAPLVAGLFQPNGVPFADWPPVVAGSLYLALPVFAAVALRGAPGTVESRWFTDLASFAAFWGDPTPRGLAWTLLVVVGTWIGDSAAFLVGRRWGRTPLLPRISPKKTVEGAMAAVVATSLVAITATTVFEMGLPLAASMLIGIFVSLAAQTGDLAESLLKRQVGVKDSGALIPGHGGMLDRMDALIVALPIGWLLARIADRFWP